MMHIGMYVCINMKNVAGTSEFQAEMKNIDRV